MDSFEKLLEKERSSVERFVRFRLNSHADADDVLQETYVTAYQKFSQLKNENSFKAWIISIARNKCNDYFRRKAAQLEIPIEELNGKLLSNGRYGRTDVTAVRETLDLLGEKDKQILYLYFWKEMPQADIAKLLNIPLGTVKSRLHNAKHNFKNKYPYHTEVSKGERTMKKMPEFMPEYTITQSDKVPFSVKWEELMGWFIIPKLGEKLSWGSYDMPSRKLGELYELEVIGKAEVHGIEGVEIKANETALLSDYIDDIEAEKERTFVVQLTDTRCRYLAESHVSDGVRKNYTFLDGDSFLDNWGFGNDNCGNETNLSAKGDIKRQGNIISSHSKEFLLDIVGRYTVTIGEKSYDTVCVMDIYNTGVVSEQFLDKNGRTVLWRRFNRDDWAIGRYKRPWSEQLSENEKLIINGTTYVHWYDCITEYVL